MKERQFKFVIHVGDRESRQLLKFCTLHTAMAYVGCFVLYHQHPPLSVYSEGRELDPKP